MALIGSIDISIGANTQRLRKGLSQAGGMLKRFGNGLMKFGKMAAAGIGVAAAAITGLGVVVNQAFTSIDKLAKTSDKLGILPDRLEGLRHAAGLAGVEVNSFDTALQRLTRRTSAAALGQGEAVKAFQELGLSASEMNKLSPDEQLMKIADAFEGVENQSDKVRLAFALFDTEGVNLVNMLNQGSEAIDEQSRLLERFGLATTRDGAASVEMFNDQWANFVEIIGGVVSKIATEVAPILSALVDYFSDGSDEAVNFGEIIETAFDIFAQGIGLALDGIEVLRGAWYGAQSLILRGLTLMVDQLRQWVDTLNAALELAGMDPVELNLVENIRSELDRRADELGERSAEHFQKGFDREATKRFMALRQKRLEMADEVAEQASERAAREFVPDAAEPQAVFAGPSGGATAVLAGTQAAAAAINQPQRAMEKIAKDTLSAQKRTADGIDELNQAIRSNDTLQLVPIGTG